MLSRVPIFLVAAHSNGDGEGITTTDIHDDPDIAADDAGYDNGDVTNELWRDF